MSTRFRRAYKDRLLVAGLWISAVMLVAWPPPASAQNAYIANTATNTVSVFDN